MKFPEQIIKRPLLTEKGTAMGETANKVLFEVDLRANKIEIRKAVEKIYNVKVHSVHTQLVRGKIKRLGRHVGKRPNWKRAIVPSLNGSAAPAKSASASRPRMSGPPKKQSVGSLKRSAPDPSKPP